MQSSDLDHAATSNFSMDDSFDVKAYKTDILEHLVHFEDQRSSYFTGLYQNNCLYWQSFVDIIRRNQTSTEKTIKYLIAKLAITRSYAISLYGIRDGVVGNKSGTTSVLREKERLEANKEASRSHVLALSRGAAEIGSGTRPPSALENMFDMEEKSAMMMLNFCDAMESDVLNKMLKAMASDLGDRFTRLLSIGDACITTMAENEGNTNKAYESLKNLLSSSINDSDTYSLEKDRVSQSDVWFADMSYRVTVSQQLASSDAISAQLGAIFGCMKDLEVCRRTAIKNALLTLLQAQDSVWRLLPILKDPVLQVLERINMDRRSLDLEVRDSMRFISAEKLKNAPLSDMSDQKRMGESIFEPLAQQGLPGIQDDSNIETKAAASAGREFSKELDNPLKSSLAQHISIFERKKDTLLARWQPCLAVITADRWLHLFDLPRGAEQIRRLGQIPEDQITDGIIHSAALDAFRDIVPIVKVSDAVAAVNSGKDLKTIHQTTIFPPVTPALTLDLCISEATYKDTVTGGVGSGASMEVLEVVRNKGMKKMFKDYDSRRIQLRGTHKTAVKLWVDIISEIGRDGMKEALAKGSL